MACCWVVATPCLAQSLPREFTLPQFVPDDFWMFIAGCDTPEQAWVDAQWDSVFDALKESGLDREVVSLVLALAEDDPTQRQAHLAQITAMIDRVRWRDLIAQEIIVAERLAPTANGYGYMFLTKVPGESVDANFAGLVGILQQLASMTNLFSLSAQDSAADAWWFLELQTDQQPQPPIRVDLFRFKETIGITLGQGAGADIAKEVIALLTGKSRRKSIVDSPRFKEALARVEPPEHFVMFFDIRRVFQAVEALLTRESEEAHRVSESERGTIRALREAVSMGDVLDYSITSKAMSGRRERRYSLTLLQPSKLDRPLARAFLDRRPFERIERLVPLEATSFSMNGGVDLGPLYGVVTEFVRDQVPGGPGYLQRWNAWLDSRGVDLQRDFFSWWSGEVVSVKMEPLVPNPFKGDDGVLMIRVRDPRLAAEKVNAAVEFLRRKSQRTGQMLLVSPARVQAEGFCELTHPAMAMFLRPVVGVHEEWLMLGTSAGAIDRCLDVAAGRSPSILECRRFREEGLIPQGPVFSASFSDRANYGQQMGETAAIVGVFAAMLPAVQKSAPPVGPNGRDARRWLSVMQSTLAIMAKLGPVFQRLDFYSSESSLTVVDGPAIRQEAVVTYKGPISQGDVESVDLVRGAP